MTRNQFQTGNVRRELFRPSCSFFKVAKDMLNCCRFFICVYGGSAACSVGAITHFCND